MIVPTTLPRRHAGSILLHTGIAFRVRPSDGKDYSDKSAALHLRCAPFSDDRPKEGGIGGKEDDEDEVEAKSVSFSSM